MQIVTVMNIASLSKARAPPTSVVGPLSLMSSHRTNAMTPAAPAVNAETIAYSRFGHGGVSAPTTSRPTAPPSRIRSGESANHWISGPTKMSS